MDIFSEELFNVFEETEKPSSTKSKKRKRGGQEGVDNGDKNQEDSKKVRIESGNNGDTVAVSTEASASSFMEVDKLKDGGERGSEVNQDDEM